ncbi:MAG: glycosyltransferase family 1 protein, partial [Pseudomonadales bacterium]
PSTMKFPGAWIERLLMPRAIRSADAVIAVSKFTAETIGKKFPRYQKKVQVIYQSSFLEVGGSGDCESKLFLSVGTHEPRKNYDRLLRAFAIVLKDHPEVRLVIVGKHGWKIDLQSLVHRYGLSEQVTLDTGADDKRLAQLYRECQALIMPSLYEGFGLPLVEALHFGKPIITSNCSAMPEVAADAAYLVDPMDTQDIARGISRVLEDDSLRRGLAAASQQRAKFFSWHTAGINTVALFEKVVSSERVC